MHLHLHIECIQIRLHTEWVISDKLLDGDRFAYLLSSLGLPTNNVCPSTIDGFTIEYYVPSVKWRREKNRMKRDKNNSENTAAERVAFLPY